MLVEWTTLVAVAIVFLFAGFVKGIVAIGLPAISISLLSHIIGVREAVFITLAPAFLTSVAQAVAGPALMPSVRRLWPLLLVGALGVFAASRVAVHGNPRILAGTVGSLIALYAAASLLKFRFPHPGEYEKIWTVIIGIVGGLLGGMSGMFAIPGVPYIQSLRLDRETMIQSIAINVGRCLPERLLRRLPADGVVHRVEGGYRKHVITLWPPACSPVRSRKPPARRRA